jgi:hypothetical protein
VGTACERHGPGVLVLGLAATHLLIDDLVWRGTLQHEMLHAFGFGHTCFRPSVMTTCPFSWLDEWTGPRPAADLVSVYDAAYVQFYRKAHQRILELSPHMALLEALDGERELLLGLDPLEPEWWR